MKSEEEVKNLEKLLGQLQGMYSEISQLVKKSPNDGLNLFKLKLVNKVLKEGNSILADRYRPFEDFSEFTEEQLPTNSDVAMVLALYMEQAERFRSDNVTTRPGIGWVYLVDDEPSKISAKSPTRIGGEK